jgi:hypothetical protein
MDTTPIENTKQLGEFVRRKLERGELNLIDIDAKYTTVESYSIATKILLRHWVLQKPPVKISQLRLIKSFGYWRHHTSSL